MSKFDELADAVGVMADELSSAASDVAVHFTCSEWDSLVRVVALAGRRETAVSLIEAHADNPDEEDGDHHFEVTDAEAYLTQVLGVERKEV